MNEEKQLPSTGIPDTEKPEGKIHTRPTGNHLRLLKFLRLVQTLCGVVAIFLIPLLWGSWSTTVMGYVLGGIIGAAVLFTLLSRVLQGPTMRGDI